MDDMAEQTWVESGLVVGVHYASDDPNGIIYYESTQRHLTGDVPVYDVLQTNAQDSGWTDMHTATPPPSPYKRNVAAAHWHMR